MVKILDYILTFLGLIIAIGVILLLSYIFSKYIGHKVMGYSNSANIKIIDRIAIGQDKSLAIVEVGKKYYLIGISSSNINMLNELSLDDLDNIQGFNKKGEEDFPQFKSVFTDILSKVKR